jgi:hypothetical protein
MDSYNRGYNAGLSGLGGVGSQIGNAVVGSDSSVLGTGIAVAASFFAQAYTWNGEGNGRTVISYRGTDIPGWLSPGGDVWNGWVTAGGARPN